MSSNEVRTNSLFLKRPIIILPLLPFPLAVRVDHRLVLFYLANDVIQYSKRKRYEFVECWATALQRATTMVR